MVGPGILLHIVLRVGRGQCPIQPLGSALLLAR